MPSPCSTSLSAETTAADASLGLFAPTTSDASGVLQENAGAPFETLLAKCDDAATLPGEAPCASPVPVAPLTAEQLALLAALALQPPAPATPPPAEPGLPERAFSRVAGEDTSLVEQLASGTETLEYRLTPETAASASAANPAPVPGTKPSTEPTPRTGSEGSPSDGNAGRSTPLPTAQTPVSQGGQSGAGLEANARPMPSAAEATLQASASAVAAEASAAAAPGTAPVSGRSAASGRNAGLTRGLNHPENFSAGSLPTSSRGEVSLASTLKNVPQATSDEGLPATQAALGTFAANSGKLMTPETLNAQPTLPGDTLVGQVLPGPGASTQAARVVEATPAPASHAASLVHEIRDIADGLWAIDRNTVEVRFDFGQQEKLSIRVEYREGQVQATFRTDSPELRDAIAREWQQQSNSSDPRPYRVADPVFSGSGFTAGGDSSRQQRSAEQASFEQTVATTAARSASTSTNPTAVAPAPRPEATGLLHAIA